MPSQKCLHSNFKIMSTASTAWQQKHRQEQRVNMVTLKANNIDEKNWLETKTARKSSVWAVHAEQWWIAWCEQGMTPPRHRRYNTDSLESANKRAAT